MKKQILFASDMPFDPEQGPGYIRSTLRAIAELEIEPEARHRILADNARQLCGLLENQRMNSSPPDQAPAPALLA